jgi:hypothetical protein
LDVPYLHLGVGFVKRFYSQTEMKLADWYFWLPTDGRSYLKYKIYDVNPLREL